MITLSGSYMFGLISWIAFELSYKLKDNDEEENFIQSYELDTETRYVKCVSVIYWVCTTFSTVGFGDFYPKNGFERLIAIFYFVGGQILFTYILNNFGDAVDALDQVAYENEDYDRLM